MTLSVWLSFLLVAGIQTASPGPTVSLLVTTSIAYGPRRAIYLMPGIFIGDTTLIIAAFAIATAALSTSALMLDIIRIGGGMYLVLLGVTMFVSNREINSVAMSGGWGWQQFVTGFLTTALNPKGILFFITLLPQFISSEKSFEVQFAVLGVCFLVVGLLTDFAYIFAAAYGSKFLTSRVRLGLVRAAGFSLVVIGLFVLFQQAF
ncbi:LysE family translocator [Phyllobacterium myrsinacearum]|uniref:LysE family translocator n=1 Tax=Phyllobacterium myrsinacearum TaxID=28101 RepID=A0A2S9JA46_9HYPH|nr:LysE family translocator [Phyllobacterium myrsinacearum]PRD49665.1 hypothetical protein C5750_24910 [Phyllobacterium myrsinacearum]PWV94751.1 threonine/homoserine/homoserine lactone efflux protein [Phyllobacterium myrsinacearum]RZV07140.1 threonine/homoserine/homoserine lactone efflux protein [Phyllobacterium myrsinacearum]